MVEADASERYVVGMTKHIAHTQISIAASPDRVWTALTTPEMIKQFMFGADVHTDWKVGSPLTYTGEMQGKKYEEKGTIKKLEPGKVLAATHFSSMSGKPDVPENYALVTWQLEPKQARPCSASIRTTSTRRRASSSPSRTGPAC